MWKSVSKSCGREARTGACTRRRSCAGATREVTACAGRCVVASTALSRAMLGALQEVARRAMRAVSRRGCARITSLWMVSLCSCASMQGAPPFSRGAFRCAASRLVRQTHKTSGTTRGTERESTEATELKWSRTLTVGNPAITTRRRDRRLCVLASQRVCRTNVRECARDAGGIKELPCRQPATRVPLTSQ
jgi:hypothetical protein